MSEKIAARVTVLFREYLWAEDEAREIDLDGLLERAGEGRAELWRRIRVHRSMRSLAREVGVAGEPESVGRFQLVQSLGAGGVGRVYLAHDPELRRQVAIKVLEQRQADARERNFMVHEARSLARLEHPGVVRVHEVGEASARAYIVMEYIQGPSLFEVVEALRRERIEPRSVSLDEVLSDPFERVVVAFRSYKARIECLIRVAEALAYAHDAGVLHRDVKPSNVLFVDANTPKLIDFGLAHLPDGGSQVGITQSLVGTPAYVSPEQVESARTGADPRSDVFSFGVLAYELLSLVQPFQRQTRTETLNAVVRSRPEALRRLVPTIPVDLARIVHHCLEQDPNARYASFDQVVADLKAVQEQRLTSLGEPTLLAESWFWIRRNRQRVAWAAGLIAVGLLFLAGQSVATGLRRRAQIDRTIDGVEAKIGNLRSPQDFRAAHSDLSHAMWDQVSYDEHFYARVLGSSADKLEAAKHLWSRRFGDVVRSEQRQSELDGTAFQQIAWRAIIELDREFCPEGHWNQGLRDAGRVALHPDVAERYHVEMQALQLLRDSGAHSGYVGFRSIGRVEFPMPGFYRLVGRYPGSPDIAWEYELRQVSTWGAPEWIVPHDRGKLFTAATRTGDTEVGLGVPDGAGGVLVQATLEVKAFRWSPLITGRQMEAFRSGGFDLGGSLDGPAGDKPCHASWQEALDFCQRAGGRLITARELQAIRGQIEAASGVDGEWVSNQAIEPERPQYMAAIYEWMESTKGFMPLLWLADAKQGRSALVSETMPTGDSIISRGQSATSFRVVFSERL